MSCRAASKDCSSFLRSDRHHMVAAVGSPVQIRRKRASGRQAGYVMQLDRLQWLKAEIKDQ